VLITADSTGDAWHVLSLGEVHGDADPPVVFSRGDHLGVALLEPTGASRTLRVGSVEQHDIHWGAEVLQGTDDSLAFDIAQGAEGVVAVWDDADVKNKVSRIYASVFTVDTRKLKEKPWPITLPGTDADQPRITRREGGFWVSWLAHRPEPAPEDNRYHAEDLSFRWIEVAQLDEGGHMSAKPMRVSPVSGHVQAYDLIADAGQGAMLAWRDNDMPTGAPGGTLWYAAVRPSGIDEPVNLDTSSVQGVGEPRLLPGWLSISVSNGATLLGSWAGGQVDPNSLLLEPKLGAGLRLIDWHKRVLVDRPAGRSSQL
jgi:hypothetical protein